MQGDEDLAGVVPKAPPPDAERRRAAIEASLRRFDAQAGDRQRPAGAKPGTSRAPVAVLASIALVVLITVPVLLSSDWQSGIGKRTGEAPIQAEGRDFARKTTPDIAPPGPLGAPSAESRARSAGTPEPVVAVETPTAARSDASQGIVSRSPTAAADVASPALAMAPPPPPPPAPALLPAREAIADDADSSSIVVTGARVAGSAQRDKIRIGPRQRSELTACTVLDPRQDLRRCGGLADAAKPGASGDVEAQLAKGLTLAWRGDGRDALRAFDAAIASGPGSAAAHLNRGLLRRESGQSRAALADFTDAIEADPDDARAYYFRSLLLRRMGETERADEDLARVREIAGE